MPSLPQHPEVLITATEDGRANLEDLAIRLAAKGLANGNAMPNIGIISGTASLDVLAGLRSDPGVASVELSGDVQLPSPDSEVQ